MPEAETDVELIEHLDFESTEPCDCTVATGEPAVWVGRCGGCPALIWMCDEHRAVIEQQIIALKGRAACTHCGRAGATLEDIFHVIPLRSR